MGLEIFGKTEKPTEERKLEAVQTEAATIDDLLACFEQSIPTKFDSFKEVFENYLPYLKGYQKIKPAMISNVSLALSKEKQGIRNYLAHKGLFLTALIQTSYEQGFNNFEFEEVYANYFGSFLVGKKEDPIRIKMGKLEGNSNFERAKDFSARIQTLEGWYTFDQAESGILEINSYKGKELTKGMQNCKVYSPNPQALEEIKKQSSGRGNEYILGNMPEGILK